MVAIVAGTATSATHTKSLKRFPLRIFPSPIRACSLCCLVLKDCSSLLCAHVRLTLRHAAEQRDELAPPHSRTSSARARSDDGSSIPSALAVLRLITSSNFVGSCTGR